MKNVFFALAFMIGSLTFANTEVNKSQKVNAFSECCKVTVEQESTGDSVTVRACRTTISQACDAAYKKALVAIEK